MTSESNHHTSLLRIACATLYRARDDQIHAISLTLRLQGTPGEERRFLVLSKRWAEEYGLREAVRLNGHSITVRFSRDGLAPRASGGGLSAGAEPGDTE